MSWRSLVISSKAQLSIENEQLCISTYEKYKIPVEDISVVVLESLQTNISTYTLSKFAERNILVFICDERHIPQGIYPAFPKFITRVGQPLTFHKELFAYQ